MDGPQHYRKAEQLLRAVERTSRNADPAAAARLIARAQVHALLALAAATATGTTAHAGQAWEDAAGTSPPMPDRPGSPPTCCPTLKIPMKAALRIPTPIRHAGTERPCHAGRARRSTGTAAPGLRVRSNLRRPEMTVLGGAQPRERRAGHRVTRPGCSGHLAGSGRPGCGRRVRGSRRAFRGRGRLG